MMKEKSLIIVPSEAKYIREVSSAIREALASCKVGADALFEIKLCVEEAVRNAMVHGNRSDKKKTVKVSYWVEKGSLNIEVEDEGDGFDPKAVPDPTKDDNLTKTSGRGVYLIKKLMDRVEFDSNGRRVRMVKRL